MSAMLLTALVLGLLGSAHCIGMCGPLALAVPSSGGQWGRLRSGLLLNGGRVVTYALLGAAFGTFGRGLQLMGLQQGVSIALGAVILAGLLLPSLLKTAKWGNLPARLVLRLQGAMARQLRRTSPEGLFITGVFNGLLPCGLVYLAVAGALAQDGWGNGALFMTVFGMGTWPALLGLRMGGAMIPPHLRNWMRKAAPYAYAGMAVLFILRGMGLGIPLLSPEVHAAPMAVEACD